MNGEINFSEALNKRLEILNINNDSIKNGIEIIKNKISTSFVENINFIKKNADQIYIVSGGFIEFIEPVANILGIKSEHIFCNSFIKKDNQYILNENNMMAKDMAKINALKKIDLDGIVVVIGDGYTDYEIKKYGYADFFIAYIEHVNREKVSTLADYKSNSFTDIIEYLNNLRNS